MADNEITRKIRKPIQAATDFLTNMGGKTMPKPTKGTTSSEQAEMPESQREKHRETLRKRMKY